MIILRPPPAQKGAGGDPGDNEPVGNDGLLITSRDGCGAIAPLEKFNVYPIAMSIRHILGAAI